MKFTNHKNYILFHLFFIDTRSQRQFESNWHSFASVTLGVNLLVLVQQYGQPGIIVTRKRDGLEAVGPSAWLFPIILKIELRPDETAITKKMASSMVEISAEDLDLFSKFLETEGIEGFEISIKDDEEDLVMPIYIFS